VLRLVDQPDLIAVIQVPADEISLARVTSLLSGTQDPQGVGRSPGAGGPGRPPVCR
jgi:hypothetical protein